MIIQLKPDTASFEGALFPSLPFPFHRSYYSTLKHLQKWLNRFPLSVGDSVFSTLILFFSLAKNKYLDHRTSKHLFRLVLSLHFMQKKILTSTTIESCQRHLKVRWFPTNLLFPFSSKPVLGCLVGFNVLDRCELFDEENIEMVLQKHFPEMQLVKESLYSHPSQIENVKLFYFEIEKKERLPFSLLERKCLENNLEEKLKNSIQILAPTVFMRYNEEEVYKNVLVLSQEITSADDLPQVHITLDQQSGKEIIFRVILVQVAPLHKITYADHILGCTIIVEHLLPVRHVEERGVEAHILRILIPRDSTLLRSDGSLNFYSARQKVVAALNNAIGEFRDYNGGILIKQQELLYALKEHISETASQDSELIETFFYGTVPLEKQIILEPWILSALFHHFWKHRKTLLDGDLRIHFDKKLTFLTVRCEDASLISLISDLFREECPKVHNLAYNFIESEGTFFNCVLLERNAVSEALIQTLQRTLSHWQQKKTNQKTLRIGFEHSIVSLDPRVGGEATSGELLKLLFEGLTRFSPSGQVENAVAAKIDISSDSKCYTFRLRPCFWNDGSTVSAHDFAYAWKKILSPDFKTAFASFFYSIKNAKEAKEGLVPIDHVGINALDDLTLKVELDHPTSYFLELTAHPLFSPVHRLIDQEHPEWPYQSEKNYPCNGPCQLKINNPNQNYQLIKNPLYRNAANTVWDRIVFTAIDPFQAMQAVQNQEIDWIGTPFGAWHPFYTPNQDSKIVSFPNQCVCWCLFNTTSYPFHNHKLRQAFGLVIDRALIVKDSPLPLTPAYSLLLPHYRESNYNLFPDQDIEKARKLLHEALKELGISLKDLDPINMIFHWKGLQQHTALCLEQQFKECLGIQCELHPLPWDTCFPRITEGKYQMGLMHWTSSVDDPIYTLNAFRFAQGGTNFTKWENHRFQKLLKLSEGELNLFKRSSYLMHAEEILREEMPALPLFYQPDQALVRTKLHISHQGPGRPYNVGELNFF